MQEYSSPTLLMAGDGATLPAIIRPPVEHLLAHYSSPQVSGQCSINSDSGRRRRQRCGGGCGSGGGGLPRCGLGGGLQRRRGQRQRPAGGLFEGDKGPRAASQSVSRSSGSHVSGRVAARPAHQHVRAAAAHPGPQPHRALPARSTGRALPGGQNCDAHWQCLALAGPGPGAAVLVQGIGISESRLQHFEDSESGGHTLGASPN
jgi:hypothetical protein